MPLSPDDVRSAKPERTLGGYSRSSVDRLLADLALSYERVWNERARARVEAERERTVEELLRAEVAELRARIESLRQEPERLEAENARLSAKVAELEAKTQELEADAVINAAADRRLRIVLATVDGVAADARAAARAEGEQVIRKARQRGEQLTRRYERLVARQQRELARLHEVERRIRADYRDFVVRTIEWLDGDAIADAPSSVEIVDALARRLGRQELGSELDGSALDDRA